MDLGVSVSNLNDPSWGQIHDTFSEQLILLPTFYADTCGEFWVRHCSLAHVLIAGQGCIEVPVVKHKIYYVSSLQV